MKSEDIEDIYELTPMQEGMLFHTVSAPSSGVYIQQLRCRLAGDLDHRLFEQALQTVVTSYPILRTSFHWEDLEKPLQVVNREVSVGLERLDWQDLPSAELEEGVEEFMAADRGKGFDLTAPPLMRMVVIQTGERDNIFLWSHHHLLLDGWSHQIVMRAFISSYDALCRGRQPDVDAGRPYRDYLAWLQQQDANEAEAFWRRTLAGFTTPTPLPWGSPASLRASTALRTAIQGVFLSATTTETLKSLARRQHLSLNTLIQAAWALLLSSYSNKQDVLFGGVVSGRPTDLRDIESMVGLFVNTLPVRVEIPPDERLIPWLQGLQEKQAEARRYQHCPVVEVHGWSEVPHDSPLFESMMVFENFPTRLEATDEPRTGGLATSDVDYREQGNYPLVLESEIVGRLSLRVHYDRDRFETTAIRMILAQLRTFLEAMASKPEMKLREMPLLSAMHRHAQTVEWNDTAGQGPLESVIHHLIEKQGGRIPDSVAVIHEDKYLSYQALNERAELSASRLRRLGVSLEVPVGVFLERSVELAVTFLAVLKAGGVYLPLDPTHPRQRLLYMLEDSGVAVLVTQKYLLASLPEHTAHIVDLDADSGLPIEVTKVVGTPKVRAQNTAYIIYTSGSTGQPKAAQLTHGSLCNLVEIQRESFGLGPGHRVMQFFSLSSDASLFEFMLSLASGAVLEFAPRKALPDADFVDWLNRHRISAGCMTASALAAIPRGEMLPALKVLITGGEVCSDDVIKRWTPDRRFFNSYGPAEATVCASHAEGRAFSPDLPIGRPIKNIHVYLLSRHLTEVPVGAAGRLLIGGVGVGRGYLNRPRLTAEKFIPDPFAERGGQRLYETGDLGQWRADGQIEFLGRIDFQVKIRGFRVELGEIERVLERQPTVHQGVVTAWKFSSNDQRLVAYIVPERPGAMPVAELRDALGKVLPDYMVPALFMELESLPLTPTGKVDRQVLPDPGTAAPETTENFVAPQTPAQEVLAAIWAEVLHVERIGIHDNFFHLGGDSILSLRIVSRASEEGLRISVGQIFEHGTIAALAAVAESSRPNILGQEPVTGEIPLTPIQHWFYQHRLAQPDHFNQSLLLELRQPMSLSLLEGVVQKLIEHHDVLRLRFEDEGGDLRQVNAPPEPAVPFVRIDLSALTGSSWQPVLERVAGVLQGSLSLAAGPVLRVAVFELPAPEPPRLLLAIHHLAIDGVSWRILAEDLVLAWEQQSRGEAMLLPPKTTSFRSWARGLVDYVSSGTLNDEVSYWLEQPWSEVTPLAVDFPDGVNLASSARQVSLSLSVEETRFLLQDALKSHRIKVEDLLLAALALTFAEETPERVLLVGLDGHGREEILPEVDLSRTVGWFTAIYPVLLDLRAAEEPLEALNQVKRQLREIPRRGVGFGLLRYLGSDELSERFRDLPEAEVSFNYLGQFGGTLGGEASILAMASESAGLSIGARNERPDVLGVNALVAGGRLQLTWTYSTNRHRQSTVSRLAQRFVTHCRALITRLQGSESEDFLPSDFALANLDEQGLNELASFLNEADSKD